jgi:hypothetical protein
MKCDRCENDAVGENLYAGRMCESCLEDFKSFCKFNWIEFVYNYQNMAYKWAKTKKIDLITSSNIESTINHEFRRFK